MSNQQQQAGVELSDDQLLDLTCEHLVLTRRREDTLIDPRTGRYTDHARYLALCRAAIAADRQQRGKVEPVAEMRICSKCENTGRITCHNWSTGKPEQRDCYQCYAAPQAEKAPSVQAVEPVDVEERRLSAAMGMGNSLGIKSTDALKILAAYKSVEPSELTAAPQQPSVPE